MPSIRIPKELASGIYYLTFTGKDMIGFVRDFKRQTSKEIQNNIIATEPAVLALCDIENGKYEFWSKTNMDNVKYFSHN